MPFEPGHPYYPPKHPVKDARGNYSQVAKNRAAKNIAMMIREHPDLEKCVELMFRAAVDGTPFPTSTAVQNGSPEPLSMELRFGIMRELLDRGLGKPSQSVVIDAQIRALVATTTAEDALRALAGAPAEKLLELEQAALDLGVDPTKLLDAGDDEEP